MPLQKVIDNLVADDDEQRRAIIELLEKIDKLQREVASVRRELETERRLRLAMRRH